ncbi:HU family DNA-binding protein [Entomobacter blattae]|uniref:DNA-binding protein HU n=1 Tax=Entomobacter blattae TaxID=2762277 RepID=A0A7H1NQV5_9PROT|nr:HU family DNA-binding protein [Entomobacter blattae]QNT78165.1 DNA-binding protein HU [Entomobacter blattae]
MNTSELINQLAARHNITKELSKDIIHDMLHLIVSTAASGQDVSIAGFGKFKVTNRPARQGRNPSTGEVINIPASRKFSFTTAKAVRDELNGAKAAPPTKKKK